MGIIHTTITVEEINKVKKKPCPPKPCCCTQTTSIQPPPYHAFTTTISPVTTITPVMATLATTAAPTKRILGLRYVDTGNIVPITDGKGCYVPADTKGMIWIPSLKKWVGGPECEFK